MCIDWKMILKWTIKKYNNLRTEIVWLKWWFLINVVINILIFWALNSVSRRSAPWSYFYFCSFMLIFFLLLIFAFNVRICYLCHWLPLFVHSNLCVITVPIGSLTAVCMCQCLLLVCSRQFVCANIPY